MTIRTSPSLSVMTVLLLVLAGRPAFGDEMPLRQPPVPTLAPLVKHALPSVVAVRVTKALPSGTNMIDPSEGFPDAPLPSRQNVDGSGVIVRPDGLVVTCNHVIEGAGTITVSLSDGRNFEADVLITDKDTDLAVLKIGAAGLAAVPINDEGPEPGDFVVTLGNAFGLGQSISFGVVSALHRSYREIRQTDLIEIDASLKPGNSGGPLLDLRGGLVGINTARSDDSGNTRGFGFAVPVRQVRAILLRLEKAAY